MADKVDEAPQRRAWVEPEIHTLDVEETNIFPNLGGDAGPYADCQRS
jgi:hypothetical protein